MLWRIRECFWEPPWVFIHKWLRLAHKHWKHAWRPGTCARGASWYVSINVVQVSQSLQGERVIAFMFNNYTNASCTLGIFISMARMKQRTAHYSSSLCRQGYNCSQIVLFYAKMFRCLIFVQLRPGVSYNNNTLYICGQIYGKRNNWQLW